MNSQKTHLAVILAGVFLFYADSFNNFFVWNDWTLIVENFLIKDWRNLPEIFTSAFWKPLLAEPSQTYRPLVLVSFMLDLALWGLNAWGYHLVNVLLHVFNSMLAYLLMGFYVPSTTALAAAALFASHPIHTGAVTHISGRAELLMVVFLLGGLLSFLRGEENQSRLWHLASLPLFFLALLAKETAVIFPLLLIAADFTLFSSSWRNDISGRLAHHAGPLIVLGLYLVLRLTFVGRGVSIYETHLVDLVRQMPSLLEPLALFPALLLFPWKLYFIRSMEVTVTLLDLRLWLAVLWLLLGGWGLRRALRSGNQPVAFAILWLFVHLLPLFYLAVSTQSLLESWYYLPSLGFCLLAALAMSRIRFSRAGLWLACLIAVVLGGLTFDRNRDWKNDLEISLRTSASSPDNPIALRLLGRAYFRRGRVHEAEKVFQEAIALSPRDPRAHEGLGRLYGFLGKDREALVSYRRMLELASKDPYSHWRIGRFYLEKRDLAEAEKYFAGAARLFPHSSELRNDLAQVYYRLGKFDAARAELEAALKISPYSRALRSNFEMLSKRGAPS